jgi:hypothetical protein
VREGGGGETMVSRHVQHHHMCSTTTIEHHAWVQYAYLSQSYYNRGKGVPSTFAARL